MSFDNSKESGYEFEMGRIKARQDAAAARAAEMQAQLLAQQEAERKRKNLKWWILGWIFCFPIPLTILIFRSKNVRTTIANQIHRNYTDK